MSDFKNSLSKFKLMSEDMHLTKRDPISRIERRFREKTALFKPLRDVLPARRERMQRHRRHMLKNTTIGKPEAFLSTKFRIR